MNRDTVERVLDLEWVDCPGDVRCGIERRDAADLLRALLARAEQAERERDEARELADGWRTLAGIQGKTGDIFEFPWEAHP